MNPRSRNLMQKMVALALYLGGILVVILAFVPMQYPSWWPQLPKVEAPWWPVVAGIGAGSHYSARVFLTIAFGLTIFLPQVESTFVSMMRRQSLIGAPFVDRKAFTCPVCGTVNRPSVQFCVKCGSQISSGTRYWAQKGHRSGLVSGLKVMLLVSGFLAIFLGIFDLTLYLAITGYLGTDGGTIFLATVLASVPSFAGYVALKEGPLRKCGTLKQFDKLVFGDAVWILFGVVFLGLASIILLSPPTNLVGTTVVLVMQLLAGVLFLVHPLLRRSALRPVTMAYV